MSGVFHAIGKVFKGIVGVIKKIWKPVLIAVAVYFTAGLALYAMPATSAFGGSMLGITSAASAGGGAAVAGSGALSSTAAGLGMAGGGTAATAGAAGAGAAGAAATLPAVTVSASSLAGTAGTTAALGTAAAAGGATAAELGTTAPAATAPINVAPPGPPSMLARAGHDWSKMGLADKFLVASTLTKGVAGFLSPSAAQLHQINSSFVGSFYGTNANGSGAAAPSGQLIPPDLGKSGGAAPARAQTPAAPGSTGGAAPTAAPNPYAPGSEYGNSSGPTYVPGVGYMPSSGAAPGDTLMPGMGTMPGSSAGVNQAILGAQTSATAPGQQAPSVYRSPYSVTPNPSLIPV
ncbi:MAG: hypothetical protein ACREFT_06715 [Acetobacteraceae bacterium]